MSEVLKNEKPRGGVDKETEFFNGKQWKSVSDFEPGDKVLQFNENGSAELVDPG